MQQGMNISVSQICNNFAFPVNFATISGNEVTVPVGTVINFVKGESPRHHKGMKQMVNVYAFQRTRRLDVCMFDPTSKVVDPETGRTTYSRLITKQGTFSITE